MRRDLTVRPAIAVRRLCLLREQREFLVEVTRNSTGVRGVVRRERVSMLLVDELEELTPLRDRVSALGGGEELFRIAWCLGTCVPRTLKEAADNHIGTAAAT